MWSMRKYFQFENISFDISIDENRVAFHIIFHSRNQIVFCIRRAPTMFACGAPG